MLIYTIGALAIAGITIGLLVWGFKTGQFEENKMLKSKPLEEDQEET
jgi:nitrogen fixation-related uncharacterized protein